MKDSSEEEILKKIVNEYAKKKHVYVEIKRGHYELPETPEICGGKGKVKAHPTLDKIDITFYDSKNLFVLYTFVEKNTGNIGPRIYPTFISPGRKYFSKRLLEKITENLQIKYKGKIFKKVGDIKEPLTNHGILDEYDPFSYTP